MKLPSFIIILYSASVAAAMDAMDAFSLVLSEKGDAKGTQGRRQLGEEEAMDKPILVSGQVYRGLKLDDANEIFGDMIGYNVTGLPFCTDCKMSIAFSNTQECTKETHDDATIIPSLSHLKYTTDDEGNAVATHRYFSVDSERPFGKQFLSYAQNVFENPTQVQELRFTVFFYDEEGELVACSFLQPILSDEEKELAAEILAIIKANYYNMTDSISSEIEEATPIGAVGNGGNSVGNLMFSFLQIVVSAAACVFFS
jgi:hypothetical protein